MSLSTIHGVGAVMLAACFVAGTSAQMKPAPEGGTTVTVIGCLKKWEPAMAGRGGVENPARLEWVLTDLAPGTTASPALPNVLRYLVKGKDTTVALAPHVNHRVEVTGLVTGLSESTPTANPATPPKAAVAPTLTVATVKMVSTECLGGGQ